MKNYDLACIYKITNGVSVYYGSSADTIENRMTKHMSPSNQCSSKQIIESGLPWTMDVIEYFPCSCVEQLQDKEAWYIKNFPCVNQTVPGSIRRAGGIKEYKSQRYQANKTESNARRNVKHDCNVCGGKFTLRHKSQHFKTKKHQRAIAEAVALHSTQHLAIYANCIPPVIPPPTVINNHFTHCSDITNNQ